MKLSRKAMREALDTVPMDVILLGGAAITGEKKLSPKEIEFARAIAMGESKAGAYRKSRPGSRANKGNQSRMGQKLLKDPTVQTQVEAFQRAIEAQRYQTPAHLRALVIHQLTEAALNPDFPPATRVQALKALGTVTEVAAFTERREVLRTTNAVDAREKLLTTLRQAMQANAVDVDADDLLAELAPVRENADAETPPPPDPPAHSDEAGDTTHSTPLIPSPPPFDSSQPNDSAVIEEPPPIEIGSPQKDGV